MIERVLKQIDEEEARVLRLYASGMVTEETWKHLWQEWEDKRNKLKAHLECLEQTQVVNGEDHSKSAIGIKNR